MIKYFCKSRLTRFLVVFALLLAGLSLDAARNLARVNSYIDVSLSCGTHCTNQDDNAMITLDGPASGASATVDNMTVGTNADGNASVPAAANDILGGYFRTASVAGVATPATFSLSNTRGPRDPATLEIVSGNNQRQKMNTDFALPLKVRVRNSAGEPIDNYPVNFITAAGASAVLTQYKSLTDKDGIATVKATANGLVGHYQIRASVGAVASPVSFDALNIGPPTGIPVVSGSGQMADHNSAFALPLVSNSTDRNSKAVQDAHIALSGPARGPTALLTPISPVTGADGTASITATAKDRSGAFLRNSSLAGAVSPAMFAMTTIGAVPAPSVSAISPASGDALGGTSVTITGTGFTGATAVTIGGLAATGISVLNDTTITARTPAGTAGSASVVVTTAGGSNAANSLFSFFNKPVITGVSIVVEQLGPALFRRVTTLTGRNFTGVTSFGYRELGATVFGTGRGRVNGSAVNEVFVVQDDNTIVATLGSGPVNPLAMAPAA